MISTKLTVRKVIVSGEGSSTILFFKREHIVPFFGLFSFVLQTTLTKKSRPIVLFLLWILSSMSAYSQTLIKGKVTDEHSLPIPYASVSIKNSSDGTTTDSTGNFSFSTSAKGNQVLRVIAIGYKELMFPVVIENIPGTLQLKLSSNSNQLGEVVISAGSIDATDDRLLTHVKPVDLLSNASSQGDIIGAIQNLPGVQRNGGDQTGLFVRGGDATETMVLVDGATVQNPFFSNVPGVGQRSRFNPFQLKGTSFSTGGYSARYGQALSSVLDLQTTDLPEKTNISIGANLSGLMVSGAQLMGDNALEYAGNYTNLGPYYSLSKNNYDFYKAPVSTGVSSRWISKSGEKGLFKVSMSYNVNSSGTLVPDPNNFNSNVRFDLHNENVLVNTSYRYRLTDRLKLFIATAFSNNEDNILWSDTTFTRSDRRVQARAELSWLAGEQLKVIAGGEIQHYNYQQQFDTLKGKFDETLTAGFVEGEFKPVRWFAVKPGVRAEYSELLQRGNIAPRISLAVKTGQYSQIGLASGLFYQTAPNLYLLQGYRPSFEQAVHYLANYEWIQSNRSFRIEAYYKDYSQLVRENGTPYSPNPYRYNLGTVDNSSYGHAKGFDVFWRDKASIKNFDYWVTYSYVDTKRLYQNYISEATPDFISKHNLNLIVKYYPEKLHTVFSAGYNYFSGRPYYNPLAASFLSDRSPAYQNLSLKASYLATIHKVFTAFYINVDNAANYKNVLGYRYSTNGQLRNPILPPQYLSVFFGVYLSITEFKKDEL